MNLSTLDKVLWAAGFVGHVALILILVLRRRVKHFPMFTTLLAFQLCTTILLFLLYRHGSSHAYSVAYYVSYIGNFALQIAVIWEIARDVLRPTGTWISDARRGFLVWSAVGIVLASLLSFFMPSAGLSRSEMWEMRGEVLTSLLTCEVFLAMIAAANRLGLQWRSHVMALGQGLTVWALVAILGDLGDVAIGWESKLAIFDHLRSFVYLGALVFWMVAFWLPEKQRAPLSVDMQNYLVALGSRLAYDLDSVRRLDDSTL